MSLIRALTNLEKNFHQGKPEVDSLNQVNAICMFKYDSARFRDFIWASEY